MIEFDGSNGYTYISTLYWYITGNCGRLKGLADWSELCAFVNLSSTLQACRWIRLSAIDTYSICACIPIFTCTYVRTHACARARARACVCVCVFNYIFSQKLISRNPSFLSFSVPPLLPLPLCSSSQLLPLWPSPSAPPLYPSHSAPPSMSLPLCPSPLVPSCLHLTLSPLCIMRMSYTCNMCL